MAEYERLETGALTHPKWKGHQGSLEHGGGGGHNGGMEQRVAALEADSKEIRAILGRLEPMITRIDATTVHLATKGEAESIRSELKGVIGTLAVALGNKPDKSYLWMIVGVLAASVLAATALGAAIATAIK